jgi:hypothetical protein
MTQSDICAENRHLSAHRFTNITDDKTQVLLQDFGGIDDAYWLRLADNAITVQPLAVTRRSRRGWSFFSYWAEVAFGSVLVAIAGEAAGGRLWLGIEPPIRHRADGHACFDRSAHDYAHCAQATAAHLATTQGRIVSAEAV